MLDDPEKYQGAPISLQLVGRRYEDEKVCSSTETKLSDNLTGYLGGRSNGLYQRQNRPSLCYLCIKMTDI